MNDSDNFECVASNSPRPIRNTLVASVRYLALLAIALSSSAAGEIYLVCKVVQWARRS